MKTPIVSAVQNGTSVRVYNEKGSTLITVPGKLYGYTASTVSVRRGNTVFTLDGKGRTIQSAPVR
jgi:hypothetical protein